MKSPIILLLTSFATSLLSAQNVGIGTNTPVAKLDIVGSIKITDGTQAAGKVLTSNANGLASWSTMPTTYWTTGYDNRDITNINSGNVGIGTAYPSSKLTVARDALINNITVGIGKGMNNTVFGHNGLLYNTTGQENTAVGYLALTNNVTGSSNSTFGARAEVYSNNLTNATAIGAGALVKTSNSLVLGAIGTNVGIGTSSPTETLHVEGFINSSGYRCRGGVTDFSPGNVFNWEWTGSQLQAWVDATHVGTLGTLSDRRIKSEINAMHENATAKIMMLKPVSFKFKKINDSIFKGSSLLQEGFIADELQQVIPSAVNGDKDAITEKGAIQPQTVNVLPIVAVLTKAVQEQQKVIEELQQEIGLLKSK